MLSALHSGFRVRLSRVAAGRHDVTSGPIPLEITQCNPLAVPVAGLPEDRGRALVHAARLLEPAHLPQREAEIIQRRALAVPVTGLPVNGKTFLVRADRLLKPARPHQREAEIVQRHALAVRSPVSQ